MDDWEMIARLGYRIIVVADMPDAAQIVPEQRLVLIRDGLTTACRTLVGPQVVASLLAELGTHAPA